MKETIVLVLIAALWIGCGYINRGYWIGYFTTYFASQEHESDANINYLFGPMGLAVSYFSGWTKYPWMRHGLSCQERYDAFVLKDGSGSLGKEWFVSWGGNGLCKVEDLKDPVVHTEDN